MRKFEYVEIEKIKPHEKNARTHSEEQIQKIEERGADFETGTVDVYTVPADNIEAHGTDIIVRNLKRSAIDQLKSVNIWNQTTTDDDDDINSIINEIKPAFHIGEIDNEHNIIKEKANLPWKNTESSRDKFVSLYQNLIDLQTNDKYPSIEKNLDSYLKMLWILGLSLPVEYISDSPEELSSDECKYVYEIQNNETSSKKIETKGKYGDILNLHSQIGNDFKVFVDDVQILRPIKFIEETKTDAQFKDNIIFYGKFEPDLSTLDPEMTGGKLKLEAIIKWAPRIVPKEHVGVSIRINGASGALFDPEFMNWQLAEYMLKKQMTIEINILDGFESALNIDRESFNFAHPHYQLVMRWLHKALRQVVNVIKSKKKEKKEEINMGELGTIFNKFFENNILSYIQMYQQHPIKLIALIIDLFLVVCLVYLFVRLVKGSRTWQLVKGIALLIIATWLSGILGLNILHYILSAIMNWGVILIIVIFQPEIRRALEQLGTNKFAKFFGIDKDLITRTKEDIYKVVIAATELSKSKTGALIVLERDIKIKDIVSTGVEMNSEVSPQLLVNIFVPNTPLHDGAVIISENKISAAACMLPLASDSDIAKELGTRHRAAIGISKESDAIVVVVSEETGKISVAKDGTLIADVREDVLKKILISNIITKRFTEKKEINKERFSKITKIFNILHKNKIPVKIYDADKIKNAFKGIDYIGIVPEQVIPIGCNSYFKKYKPTEFTHMIDNKMFKYIKWEPLEKVELK